MKRLKSMVKWMNEGWPFFIVLSLAGIHITLSFLPNTDMVLTNVFFGQALPLLGGIISLLSIDKDIQEFREMNMWSFVKKYWQSCPSKKQNYVLSASPVTYSLNVSKPTLSVMKNWTTTEDGLKELERRIEELRKFITEVKQDNENEHTKFRSELNTVIGKSYEEIQEVINRLDRTVMGNINYQIFGFLLVLYGFIVNISLLFFR